MNCSACGAALPPPMVAANAAWVVCAECGEALALPVDAPTTDAERIKLFEERHGLRIPADYPALAGREDGWVFALPLDHPWIAREYPDGYYEVGEIASLDPHAENSLFHSDTLSQEWGLPASLARISHTCP